MTNLQWCNETNLFAVEALADELGDAALALSFDAEDTDSVRALVEGVVALVVG